MNVQRVWVIAAALVLFCSCSRKAAAPIEDRPRIPADARVVDVTFHSSALSRDVQYRVVEPAEYHGEPLPVVYLLHGANGTFRDWTNYSDVARYVGDGMLLVMPEADESWYTNSANNPKDRYEDYVVQDLPADVRERFSVRAGNNSTAAVGVSMGGYGAIKIALHHPELFGFVGALSPAVDVTRRGVSPHRISQWLHYRAIFGPAASATRRNNDPFLLIRSADPKLLPLFYITCGTQESLFQPNRQFAYELRRRDYRFEFHPVTGGHDWQNWNAQLPALFVALRAEMRESAK